MIDETLKFLLNKIAEIDGGPTAEEYLKDNQYYQGMNNWMNNFDNTYEKRILFILVKYQFIKENILTFLFFP